VKGHAVQIETGSNQLHAAIDGGVGWLTFDNPERLNALSVGMAQASARAIDAFDRHDAVRVVVVTGGGDRAFISGADISEFGDRRTDPSARAEYDALLGEAWQVWDGAKKPRIAMINGFCLGGGLALALRCDIRVASDTAQFAIPAARLGLGYSLAGIKKLLSVVNPAFAAEILFTARRFNATEALTMGLINRVVDAKELKDTVAAMAETISMNAPLTVHAARQAIAEAQKPAGEQDPEKIRLLVEQCFRSEDYLEGQAAFAAKRPPEFRGH